MTEDILLSYIEPFRKRFIHNDTVYAVNCVNEPFTPHPKLHTVEGKITNDLIELHLRGGLRLFVYPTAKDGTVRFCCWDLYYTAEDEVDYKTGIQRCKDFGLSTVLETNDSLDRGPRVWHFMPVPSQRDVMRNYRDVFGHFSVVFHPDAVGENGEESPIRLPLAYTKTQLGYTSFVDIVGNGVDPLRVLA